LFRIEATFDHATIGRHARADESNGHRKGR
jgi:hypothetical protein